VGLCERSIWQAIKDGKLKAAKIGRSVRIHRDELDRFIRESQVVSGGPLRHRAAPEAGRESPGRCTDQAGTEAAPAHLPAAVRRSRT
jgi:excisionase family DNA binding protein